MIIRNEKNTLQEIPQGMHSMVRQHGPGFRAVLPCYFTRRTGTSDRLATSLLTLPMNR